MGKPLKSADCIVLRQYGVQTTDEFSAMRSQYQRDYIGGSEIGSIAGWSPTSPRATAEKKLGNAPPFEGNEFTEWGHILEEPIAQKFASVTGKKIRKRHTIFGSSKYPFAICNIDRDIVGEQSLLECKSTGYHAASHEEWGETGSDLVPRAYNAQVQWMLGIMGYDHAYLAVLIGGNDFRWYSIPADVELQEMLFTLAGDFMENLDNGILPEMDGSKQMSDILKYKYSKPSSDLMIEPTPEMEEDAEKLRELKPKLKDLTNEIKTLENKFKERIGLNIGISNIATYKASTRRLLDSKALKNAHPTIYEKFVVATPQRRFALTKKRG